MITKIPEEEKKLLASGIKFPDNEEWWDNNEDILAEAIDVWKAASKKEREKWKEEPAEFYETLDPGLSDDGWDYIQPDYTYMEFDSILRNTEGKFFGPTIKKAIIQSVLNPNNHTSDWLDDISIDIREYWQAPGSWSLKQAYEAGRVTKQFADFMDDYKDDPEAWDAVALFYDSGGY